MIRIDPRVKLLFILLSTTLAILCKQILPLIILTIFVFINSIFLGLNHKLLYTKMKRIIPLIIGISLVQIIFVRTGDILFFIGDFNIVYSDGIHRAITLMFRFFIIVISTAIMALENNRKIISSFAKLHITYLFYFMLMITIKFVPFFQDSFNDAIVAIQLRGIDLKRIKNSLKIEIFSYILLPICADAIVKSKNMAIAMSSKGFNCDKHRTYYTQVKLIYSDYVIMIIYIVLFVCYIMKGNY